MHSAPCLHALAQLAPPLMHCFGCRWWWPRIFSGTSSPTCPGRLPARSGSTPPRTSNRSAPTPPSLSRSAPSLSLDSPCAVLRLACSLHFTGARLGPGHHREGHCQPCRRDPLCSQCVPIICCVLCPHTACPAAASIALLSQRKCRCARSDVGLAQTPRAGCGAAGGRDQDPGHLADPRCRRVIDHQGVHCQGHRVAAVMIAC